MMQRGWTILSTRIDHVAVHSPLSRSKRTQEYCRLRRHCMLTVWFLAATNLSHSQIQLATGLPRSSDTLVFRNNGESRDFVFCFLGQIISQFKSIRMTSRNTGSTLLWIGGNFTNWKGVVSIYILLVFQSDGYNFTVLSVWKLFHEGGKGYFCDPW